MSRKASVSQDGERKQPLSHQRSIVALKSEPKELLKLLDSPDLEVSNEAFTSLRESVLSEPEHCVGVLVSHYVRFPSDRLLELIALIREPNEKYLLDRMCEHLKGNQIPAVIGLLQHIAHRQPSWLPKLSQHSVFTQLLKVLNTKVSTSAEHVQRIVSGLVCLCMLLPQCALLTHAQLTELCIVMVRAAQLVHHCGSRYQQQDKDVMPIDQQSLQNIHWATQQYFMRLYGLFPCNLVNFLKQQMSNQHASNATKRVFYGVIQPMLFTVRLHPGLILANREIELSRERWAGKEIHDIVDECQQVTCDGQSSQQADAQMLDMLPTKPQSSQLTRVVSSYATSTMTVDSGVVNTDRHHLTTVTTSAVGGRPLQHIHASSHHRMSAAGESVGQMPLTTHDDPNTWPLHPHVTSASSRPVSAVSFQSIASSTLPITPSLHPDSTHVKSSMHSWLLDYKHETDIPPNGIANVPVWTSMSDEPHTLTTSVSDAVLERHDPAQGHVPLYAMMTVDTQQQGVDLWSPSMAVGLNTPPALSSAFDTIGLHTDQGNRSRNASVVSSNRRLNRRDSLRNAQPNLIIADHRSLESSFGGSQPPSRHHSFRALLSLFTRNGSQGEALDKHAGARNRNNKFNSQLRNSSHSSLHRSSMLEPSMLELDGMYSLPPEEPGRPLEVIHSRHPSIVVHLDTIPSVDQISAAEEAEEAVTSVTNYNDLIDEVVEDNDDIRDRTPMNDMYVMSNEQSLSRLTSNADDTASNAGLDTSRISLDTVQSHKHQDVPIVNQFSSTVSSLSRQRSCTDTLPQPGTLYVRDFMTRVNRQRFDSQCHQNVQEDLMESGNEGALNQTPIRDVKMSDSPTPNFGSTSRPFRKRSLSCPQKFPALNRRLFVAGTTMPVGGVPEVAKAATMANPVVSVVIPDVAHHQIPIPIPVTQPLLTQTSVIRPEQLSVINTTDPTHSHLYRTPVHVADVEQTQLLRDYIHAVETKMSKGGQPTQPVDPTLSHIDGIGQNLPVEKQVELLRSELVVYHQRLMYEKFISRLNTQRARRLYGRYKQTHSQSSVADTDRKKIRILENEIDKLQFGITELRKDHNQALQDKNDVEFQLRKQLQQTNQHMHALKTELKVQSMTAQQEAEELTQLRAELGSSERKLQDVLMDKENVIREHAMCNNTIEKLRAELTDKSSELCSSQLLIQTLYGDRAELAYSKAKQQMAEQLVTQTGEQAVHEVNSAKRRAAKANARSEALAVKALTLEDRCGGYMRQIHALHAQLDEQASLQQQRLNAGEQKYQILNSVAQRQEAHIMQLYAQINSIAFGLQSGSKSGKSEALPATLKNISVPQRMGTVEIGASVDSSVGGTPVSSTVLGTASAPGFRWMSPPTPNLSMPRLSQPTNVYIRATSLDSATEEAPGSPMAYSQ